MILQMPYTSRGFQHLKPNLQYYAIQSASADNFGKISTPGFIFVKFATMGLPPTLSTTPGTPPTPNCTLVTITSSS